jgi:hypothetical protein
MKSENTKKKVRTKDGFDSVAYFRSIKQKLAIKMKDMTLEEHKAFMKKVREGKVTID